MGEHSDRDWWDENFGVIGEWRRGLIGWYEDGYEIRDDFWDHFGPLSDLRKALLDIEGRLGIAWWLFPLGAVIILLALLLR